MATHSTLAWRIPWTEEPAGYSPWGFKESDTTSLSFFFSFMYGCESWTIKKPESQRVDAFEL